MTLKRPIVFVVIALIITFAIAITWLLTPRTIQGSLSVSPAGVTNEQGQVLFTVKNQSSWQIIFWARVETKTNDGWPPFPAGIPLSSLAPERQLGPKQQTNFYVNPPLWERSWRLCIHYYAKTTRERVVLKTRDLLDASGMQTVADRLPLDYGGYVVYPEETNQ
jgi:hypothetical protein